MGDGLDAELEARGESYVTRCEACKAKIAALQAEIGGMDYMPDDQELPPPGLNIGIRYSLGQPRFPSPPASWLFASLCGWCPSGLGWRCAWWQSACFGTSCIS